ncbi:holin [Aquamicrobium phage P14]|uniref:Holin n=1 Tax=Aquamicrobium phage P14 TaxID=1927013 RepID=A0A1L5C068_9CAUD|nr:holin [Aquamicrobium phage P14]APL99503.1 hypothetical protein BB738_0450 [Aquamicrobium phage P14]
MKTENITNASAAGYLGMTILGVPVADIVTILTGVWITCQLCWWFYQRYKEFKNGRK